MRSTFEAGCRPKSLGSSRLIHDAPRAYPSFSRLQERLFGVDVISRLVARKHENNSWACAERPLFPTHFFDWAPQRDTSPKWPLFRSAFVLRATSLLTTSRRVAKVAYSGQLSRPDWALIFRMGATDCPSAGWQAPLLAPATSGQSIEGGQHQRRAPIIRHHSD